ncbi:MAG: TIGR00282 family metallophosphoesterase [Clostridiales bacterium]|nr:TIGR00282 family metallophosphoesterase [Clostridiales bacterium]
MRLIFIGDICYKSGRKFLADRLKSIIKEYEAEFCIVNGENSAGGKGINQVVAKEIFVAGADVITTGNHIWSKKEVFNFIDSEKRVLRPLNYHKSNPGRGHIIIEKNGSKLAVVNLSGRVYMELCNCPFEAMEEILPEIKKETKAVLVDFHAEATSEKAAFAWNFDGRVSAVIGTHTHVQTADERILPFGTGFITDAGMTGPYEGVIGADREVIINKFTTGLPGFFTQQSGRSQINGLFLEIDETTGKCTKIERIYEIEN